jgi:hypothetical protein
MTTRPVSDPSGRLGQPDSFAAATTLLLAGLLVFAATGTAQAQAWITYSPLTGIGVGPNGPAGAKIETEPFCCPSTALLVTAREPVGEDDFQWVNLGLTVPWTKELQQIRAVEVCYEIKTVKRGSTYISQTRLTEMNTPDSAVVKMDDPTDRALPGPTCYSSEAGFTPAGTVTLALKVVFGSVEDEIRLGEIRLRF